MHLLILCEIFLVLALATNLLAGYSGLLSLCQAAFFGTGAYTGALLLTKLKLSFSLALSGAILFNLVACIPIILFSIRLRDLFFSLATMAWQVIVFSVLYNWIPITGGPFGISNIPTPKLFGFEFNSITQFAFLGGTISTITLCAFILFHNTPLSLYLQGTRDDQLAMMTFGKRPGYYKTMAILLSSAVSAIAGVLYATYFGYIDANPFSLTEAVNILSIVLIGGLGSIRGAIAGVLFYVLLPELLRQLHISNAIFANLNVMINALILILVLMYRPQGLLGKYKYE